MTENNRNRVIAAVSTIAVHIVVLLILASVVLRSNPVPEDLGSGVFVQMGYIDEASGTFEPYVPEPVKPVVEPTPQEQLPELGVENLITQDSEESIALEEKKKREEQEMHRREEERRRAEEERRLAEQREKEQRVSNAMQNAFGGGSQNVGSRGDAAQGNGVQGVSTGNAPTGASQGVGGWGGFSLNGRKCLDLPKPAYNSNVEGTVVVEITVDKNGRVIAASVKAGSAPHTSLRKAALEAAQKARFDTSSEGTTQVGTITYYFRQR